MTLNPSTDNLTTKRVWFITGASQGFGLALVKAVLARGDCVIATSRKPEKITAAFPHAKDRLLAFAMDLRSPRSIKSAMQSAIFRFGHIDVLVNNAGYGLMGAVEEATDEETMALFEINVFGVLRVTRALLPHFRDRHSGHILNFSSVYGLVGMMGFGIYNATKFAVEGMSEALAMEVAPLGIKVTILEPEFFRTNFLGDSLALTQTKIDDYAQTAGESQAFMELRHGNQPNDPARGAEIIIDIVNTPKPPLHLPMGELSHMHSRAKCERLIREMDAWKVTTLNTEYPPAIPDVPPSPVAQRAAVKLHC